MVAIVDEEDFERVSKLKWHAQVQKHKDGTLLVYAHHTLYEKGKNPGKLQMHSMILPDCGRVDHRDGDSLNNRRSNLRPATQQQNMGNRRKCIKGTSRWKGVFLHSGRYWTAQIADHGKKKWLGTFREECDAALAYNLAAYEVFGEYARFNLPLEPTE